MSKGVNIATQIDQWTRQRDNVFDFNKDVASKAHGIASYRNSQNATSMQTALETASTVPQSAIQKVLYQPVKLKDWKITDQSTASEVLASIYSIAQTDKDTANTLLTNFYQMQATPSSPWYNPYVNATNNAIAEIAALGIDVSGGINEKFFNDNAWLKDHYRYGTGNSPLSPAKKATKEENAAYWYYKLLDAEETTQKAENEWAALQEEVSYWANRADRNYTFDEVLDKVNWSNYKTLDKLDADRLEGRATMLNRSVGYSRDNLRGVYWAARNTSSGDAAMDSMMAAMEAGRGWSQNDTIRNKLNPASADYSPYSVGSTLDDAALYFGVSSFGKDWLEKNRGYLANGDETAQKMYGKVYEAEQNTQKAEAELKELRDSMEDYLSGNKIDAEQVLSWLKDDYDAMTTLKRMDESREKGGGNLVATTRAVNYRWEDIEAEVRRRADEKNKRQNSAITLKKANDRLNGKESILHGAAEQESKDVAIGAANSIIQKDGTPAEKAVFKQAGSFNWTDFVRNMWHSLVGGDADADIVVQTEQQQAADYAADHYFDSRKIIDEYENAQKELDDARKTIDDILQGMPSSKLPGPGLVGVSANTGTSDQPMSRPLAPQTETEQRQYRIWASRMGIGTIVNPEIQQETYRQWRDSLAEEAQNLEDSRVEAYVSTLPPEVQEEYYAASKTIQENEAALADLQTDYEQSQRYMEGIANRQDVAAQVAATNGVEPGPDAVQAMNDLYEIGAEYKPTVYSTETLFDAMIREGKSKEETITAAKNAVEEYTAELARIQGLLDAVPDKAKKGEVYDNVRREQERLERELKAAQQYAMLGEKDFDKDADAGLKALQDDMKNTVILDARTRQPLDLAAMVDPVYWAISKANGDALNLANGDDNMKVSLMSEDERRIFYNLYSKNPEEALEWYDYLANDTYGVLTNRMAETQAQYDEAFAKDFPVLSNVASILTSPGRVAGGAYGFWQLITGQDVNPNSTWYTLSRQSNTIKSTSKQGITDYFGENTLGAKIANLGYDVFSSVGESTMNTLTFGALVPSASGFGKIVTDFLGAVPMGLSAAGDAISEAVSKGADPSQALGMGAVTLLAEAGTEAITLGNMRDAFSRDAADSAAGLKAFIVDTIKDMGEEAAGEMINEAVESLADDAIMGELSQRHERIEYYMTDEGGAHSPQEAEDLANKEIVHNVLYAGLTGALSGAVTTTTSAAAGKVAQRSANARISRNNIAILEEAAAADVASQTGAVAAVLATDETDMASMAAAVTMSEELGNEPTLNAIKHIEAVAARAGMQPERVHGAIKTAALGKGNSYGVLVDIAEHGATREKVNNLVEAAAADIESAEVQESIDQATEDIRVAQNIRDQAANGAFDSVYASQQEAQKAKDKQRVAEKELERQQKKAEQLGDALMAAQEQYIQDPTNIKAEGALTQALNDIDGQNEVVQEYEQSLQNAEEAAAQAQRKYERETEKALAIAREQGEMNIANEDAQRALAAVQAVVEQEATEPHENRIGQQINEQAAEEAIAETPDQTRGTAYTNDNVPVQFHYALANVDDLVTSNTDAGEVNPAYPEDLQPRDRTIQANIDQVNNIARNLNPARLGESASVQDGAPIVGADNIVESGNGRTMAIRQAFQRIPEAAARYTQWLRDNAARFGLDPEAVTDRSMLVRVRDTDVDRGAFARSANESTTAGYSASETAESDAANLTPEIMELFNPDDNGNMDSTGNHSFVLAFLENVIPETERGTYEQSDGTISQQGQQRIRNAVFQKAYGSTNLTQILTEATDGNSRNVVNALLKAAPRAVQLQGAIDQGGVYDVNLGQKIAAAVQRFMQLRNAGMNVDTYLNQTTMPGMETEDAGTQAFMRLFDEFKRSPKKLAQALQNTMDALVDAGDPRVVSFLGQGEAPSVESLVRQGVSRLSQARASINSNIQALRGPTTNIQRTEIAGQAVTPQAEQTTQRPERSPIQVAKDLARTLNVGQAIGTRKMNNVPRRTRGYYENRARYVAIRSRDAGDFTVNMHEIGHGIADRINMTGTDDMVSRLDPNIFNDTNYRADELPDEAFAEFVWRYMESEDVARTFAGDDFVDTFEQRLRQTGLYRDVHNAANDIRAYVNANVADQIGSTIHSRSENQRRPLDQWFNELINANLDATNAAEPVLHEIRDQSGERDVPMDVNVRNVSLLKNQAHKRAFNILTNHMTDANWTITGDGLKQRFRAAGLTARDVPLLERYMLALHSLDRDLQNRPVFDEHITPEARMEFIEDVQQNHPEVARAEQAFQEFRKEFLQHFLVDTGYITQDTFDLLNTVYPHYVPTQRVKDARVRNTNRNGGSTYQIRTATGSTEDIWSPMDTFAGMVDSIVTMVSANNAALAWDNAYHQYSLGAFGREITPDMRQMRVDTRQLQEQVAGLLGNALGMADDTQMYEYDDIFEQVINLINTQQTQWVNQHGSSLPNVITVQHPDGTQSYYEIFDNELYKLLASINDGSAGNNQIFKAFGMVTRGMSALTTGSNPVFAIRNFMRDFQNSVNYGSWATNYATGAWKWLQAAYDVWRNRGEYQDYQALGGGGWTRIDPGTRKGAAEINSELYRGYNTQNVGRTAKWLGKKIWNGITLARLNEVVEQASRYAEYRFGQHDRTTAEGRAEAFLAAQEATVDFSRSGNGAVAATLKQIIPFFGASAQGVYRTGRMLTEGERSRAGARFTKTIVNTALLSALANGLLLKYSDDDDKEEFAWLSDDLKSKHFYIPNFAPDVFGNQPLLRIPVAQDPLMYAVHGAVTNAMWNGTTDEMMIDLSAIANTILDNLNPVGSGTVLQPIIGTMANKNWYGSKIIPTRLESEDPTLQYTADTPDLFVTAGRALNMSPLNLQYLAEQYTGYLGQMLIPAFSKDGNTGEIGGWHAAVNAARKRLTSDPLVSNDVVSSFYDGADLLTKVTSAAKKNMPLNMLRRGLTEQEASAAYSEAKTMTSTDGIVNSTKSEISALYGEIDKINANTTLTDAEKYTLMSEKRREMIELTLDAQEAIGAWKEKYVTGKNLATSALFEGTRAHIPTAYETMPSVFKADENAEYMKRATEVYQATGKDSALPHPQTDFKATPKGGKQTKYTVESQYWDRYIAEYQRTYEKKFAEKTKGKNWDSLDDEEKLSILTSTHTAANNAAKSWYLSNILHVKTK